MMETKKRGFQNRDKERPPFGKKPSREEIIEPMMFNISHFKSIEYGLEYPKLISPNRYVIYLEGECVQIVFDGRLLDRLIDELNNSDSPMIRLNTESDEIIISRSPTKIRFIRSGYGGYGHVEYNLFKFYTFIGECMKSWKPDITLSCLPSIG